MRGRRAGTSGGAWRLSEGKLVGSRAAAASCSALIVLPMPVVTLHRPLYALCRLALPLAALGLAACASEAPRPLPTRLNDVPLSTAMAVPGAAPQVWNESFGPGVGELGLRFASNAPLESAAPLLSTGLNFAGLARRLQYSAGYQFSPGDLLNPDAAQQWRSDALPQSVGTQTLHQQLRLQIDTLAGAPLTVGARSTQQDALLGAVKA